MGVFTIASYRTEWNLQTNKGQLQFQLRGPAAPPGWVSILPENPMEFLVIAAILQSGPCEYVLQQGAPVTQGIVRRA